MYRFKKELRKELMEGRTLTYLSEKIDMTISMLSQILSGKYPTRKTTAIAIVSLTPSRDLEYYFEKE